MKNVTERSELSTATDVEIVDYEEKYQPAFRTLNAEWISTFFVMEKADYKVLDDPDGYILKKGGHILIALDENEPVGVCALIKTDDGEYDFELAKMAVSPKAQGRKIGWLLGQTMIEKAKSCGASKIFLETNSILKPAVNLYRKLGFQEVDGRPSLYERCNVQMELVIES